MEKDPDVIRVIKAPRIIYPVHHFLKKGEKRTAFTPYNNDASL